MEDLNLTNQEMAVLLATRESDLCQSLIELAQNAEAPIQGAAEGVDGLVKKGILEEVDSFDGIRYGFAGNEYAQYVCNTIDSAK